MRVKQRVLVRGLEKMQKSRGEPSEVGLQPMRTLTPRQQTGHCVLKNSGLKLEEGTHRHRRGRQEACLISAGRAISP